MFKRFIALLKRFLPMPARSTDLRMRDLESNADLRMRDLENKIDLWLRDLENKADTRMKNLERKMDTIEEKVEAKLEEIDRAIKDIPWLDIQNNTQNGLEEIDEHVQEIMYGDIFRRIESLQGRLVFYENLFQRNMLTQDAQKSSREYQFIMRMRALFPVMYVDHEKDFIRVGRLHDGGYVMLDDFSEKRIAYSFGIADDVSWDRDMAERGLDVFMYDHTINRLPEENSKFHFFRTGLGLSSDINDNQLRPLEDLMKENGHLDEYDMILKIDIEGAEWDILNDIDENVLKHFSQIVFEFHGLIYQENEAKMRTALEKLNMTHQLVHLHANNYGSYLLLGGAILPELIEGTYLLKDEYNFNRKTEDMQTEFDSINCSYLPEIFLGTWNS